MGDGRRHFGGEAVLPEHLGTNPQAREAHCREEGFQQGEHGALSLRGLEPDLLPGLSAVDSGSVEWPGSSKVSLSLSQAEALVG